MLLSIIVAVTDADGELSGMDWFTALLREAETVAAEVLVAGAHGGIRARLTAAAASSTARVCILDTPPALLAPELWGLGLRAAAGDIVAFTINQCIVPVGWARTVVTGISNGNAGVGGPLHLAPLTSGTGKAVYCLRYSAFLAADGEQREVRDIAGDNAAYKRDALMRHSTYAHGFWEIEAHHWLRADGATLALLPSMAASFGGRPHLLPFMRQRFAHGRHFGAWRVLAGGRSQWQVMLASPLVPGVLFVRTARRLAHHRGAIFVLLSCVPQFFALAAAWAAGEVAGALRATRDARDRGHAPPS